MNKMDMMAKCYSFFCDEESKDTFLNRISFLVTGDYSYIAKTLERYHPEVKCAPLLFAETIVNRIKDRPLIFYGAGDDACFYRAFFKQFNDSQVIGFCDKDTRKQKNGFLGYRVYAPEDLLKMPDAFVLITASSKESVIKERLKSEYGIEEERIVDHVFPILKGVDNMYFDPEIIRFEKDGECFVDAGSYDLQTALDMKELTAVNKVFAFEADPGNVKKCMERKRKESLEIFEVFSFGLWSEKKTLAFASTGGTEASFFGTGEKVSVDVNALDDVLDPEEKITFIKMDIEGAELEALKGSRRTIQRYRPKLAICIYHKPEDMYELPLCIKELVPEYRLYLRHYSNRAHETVLYAVVE